MLDGFFLSDFLIYFVPLVTVQFTAPFAHKDLFFSFFALVNVLNLKNNCRSISLFVSNVIFVLKNYRVRARRAEKASDSSSPCGVHSTSDLFVFLVCRVTIDIVGLQ